MSKTPMFSQEQVVGIFRSFSEGGLEFHADIVLPYQDNFQSMPMHGQFLLVQLAHEGEAVLGRITSFYSEGKLTRDSGEDFSLRAIEEYREIPEELRERHVKYRVNMRMLGVLRQTGGQLVFVPSHRRLPHVGSKVFFPSDAVLKEITGHNIQGADLGFFALGEFIYAAQDNRLKLQQWMQVKSPPIVVHFPVENLVARRSFVFARAGFGKSNLVKLLFSELYKETPTIAKRLREVPVGTIVFDPEGEYFWPDDKGRPGFADVPHLQDKLVVFTRRQAPSPFYDSFKVGEVKLDLRRLRPASVIGIALSPERQEQQNVRKLRGIDSGNWRKLIDLVYKDGYNADLNQIKDLLGISQQPQSDVEATAALSNIVYIIRNLHDPHSRLMDALLAGLRKGKLCVVDISQMSGEQGLILSGMILDKIFTNNQEQFTEKDPQTIPTIIVTEEAQTVLGQGSSSGEAPYLSWFKEGRKYDLGAVMITQQPGSIPVELLSQGDNWFIFHLLSASDLKSLQKANSHFSNDLLGALLNEPLPGQGILWSSVSGNPYPISFRALSFEGMYQRLDLNYDRVAVETFASWWREKEANDIDTGDLESNAGDSEENNQVAPKDDWYSSRMKLAVEALKRDNQFQQEVVKQKRIPWGVIRRIAQGLLPEELRDEKDAAYFCIIEALNDCFGEGGWHSQKRENSKGGITNWIICEKKK